MHAMRPTPSFKPAPVASDRKVQIGQTVTITVIDPEEAALWDAYAASRAPLHAAA